VVSGLLGYISDVSEFGYFYWLSSSHKCKCGWSGSATELETEMFEEVFEYFCPKCGIRLGLMSYPMEYEIRTAAAAGNSAAKEMLKQVVSRESYAQRVMESRISSIEELHDVPDEQVSVRLSLVDVGSDTFLTVSGNDIEIGRELCFFEDPEPASRLLKILEEKFGRRLESVNWSEATLYLCGDRTSFVSTVAEIFQKYPSK
jgi:hypothetical protein